ncbi:hypothetical protein L1049_028542 [Liquidambar formosana]|uniref:HPP transmembrane region domain-containing protein n=1 Tax=Liquidambar formosana TaxID=63359 RepID=A0AAP0RL81_LIQFO
MQLQAPYHHHHNTIMVPPSPLSTSLRGFTSSISLLLQSHINENRGIVAERPLGFNSIDGRLVRRRRKEFGIVASSNVAAPLWDAWKPEKGSAAPSLSDVLWPSAGAFVVMAILGKIDQMLAPKGISMTIAPLGAVSAVLFAAPSSPAARKYNVFMSQISCAAIGVLALTIFGPGWLARSAGLAASIAFMIYTRSTHPPAASLPILFIDGAKLHHLNFWYAFFPGATGCILICLIVSSFSSPLLMLHLIAKET